MKTLSHPKKKITSVHLYLIFKLILIVKVIYKYSFKELKRRIKTKVLFPTISSKLATLINLVCNLIDIS